MTTAALGIAQGMRAALSGQAGGRVYLNRLRPLPAGANTAVVIQLIQSDGSQSVLNLLDWVTLISIECVARAASGADPASAVDALLASVWTVISTLQASALGVTSIAIDPAISWQYDDAEVPYASAVITVRVQHRTPYTSLN